MRPASLLMRRLSTAWLAAILGGVAGVGTAQPAPAVGHVMAGAAMRAPADRRCAAVGQPITEVPWYQRSVDPKRIAAYADGRGVTVAVIDSGVDSSHPQLAGRVLPGRDLLFSGNGRGDVDCVGHGTAVASIIAGGGERGIAFRGLAPQATILPLIVSERSADDGDGASATAAGFAQAIRVAVAARAQVINISLVLPDDVPVVAEAVQEAVDAGVVIVAAVGNAKKRSAQSARTPYPAAYPGVIGVGAVDQSGARAAFSPVGPWVDLVAPGDQVVAAARGRGYERYTGTSFAVPFVSATAALVLSQQPGLTAAQVAQRMFATADPSVGGTPVRASVNGTGYGYGIVQPVRAVLERAVSAVPRKPQPLSAYVPHDDNPVRANQSQQALVVALLVLAAAAAAGFGSVAVPRGRRRGWRPGRALPPAPRPTADGNRRLFDDFDED